MGYWSEPTLALASKVTDATDVTNTYTHVEAVHFNHGKVRIWHAVGCDNTKAARIRVWAGIEVPLTEYNLAEHTTTLEGENAVFQGSQYVEIYPCSGIGASILFPDLGDVCFAGCIYQEWIP